MKKKIVILPLDERPCNYAFAQRLFHNENVTVTVPPVLSEKKKPADPVMIEEYLEKECGDGDVLILSLDMLLYGGLVPSRIHQLPYDVLCHRLQTVKKLKMKYPALRIYGFQCVMRCPAYSSSDEEPDYYAVCGQEIHDLGVLIHKEDTHTEELTAKITEEVLKDYTQRRELNLKMNLETLAYVQEGIIDELIIPQDDSQPYGFAAMDKQVIAAEIENLHLQDRVMTYSGADEASLTLCARALCRMHGYSPSVYVKYICEQAKDSMPLYEGNLLQDTIASHIVSAGMTVTDTVHADMILLVTACDETMKEAKIQSPGDHPEMIDKVTAEMNRLVIQGQRILLLDNAYVNGSDLKLIDEMNRQDLTDQISGYAGWNTNANSLGTVLAMGVDAFFNGNTEAHQSFLVQRYLEDAGYCSFARWIVNDRLDEYDCSYFDIRKHETEVLALIERWLNAFIDQYLSGMKEHIEITELSSPWHRMFEVNLQAAYKKVLDK